MLCEFSSSEKIHKSNHFLMGTFVEIAVKGTEEEAARATQAVLDEMKRVENLTSFHKPSELMKVNEAAGKSPVRAAPELTALIARSLAFARDTAGAFDPTLGPLSTLWNFSGGKPKLPQHSEITSALGRTGWEKVKINSSRSTVELPEKGMSLDLGGNCQGLRPRPGTYRPRKAWYFFGPYQCRRRHRGYW